jgi:hypothetical protein
MVYIIHNHIEYTYYKEGLEISLGLEDKVESCGQKQNSVFW